MADDTRPLASLSLTHVYYDPEDPLSFLCAWLALLPQALCVVYVTLIWSTREVEVALMFLGQLGCEAANFALKRLIKEERPRRIHGKGYGMPSSHAQFVFFWALFLVLFLFIRHKPPHDPARDARYRSRALSRAERVVGSVIAFTAAAAVGWSRVYLGYHTVRQVLVGCAAGVCCAVAWFAVTSYIRDQGFLDWALRIPLVEWFRFRDLLLEEDLCQAGWEKWEEKRIQARSSKARKVK
ncbi:PAP2 superfamily protein [Sodiomyces alkalinus F11]|uniref:Dolichyldiphosphatase n=1 Tax=Sodiomyces alkalinus (strain CBS 110278 / VKM F-3762 / F11) TaxID=1314773 RepID=A0A3N2Q915_SODAK|nr:PAP2 superfamily protein [Sodiomyces alkalinus F11]ROT43187.1 PAP2 superfamily protein [Sodiomyces alkalinus F11]